MMPEVFDSYAFISVLAFALQDAPAEEIDFGMLLLRTFFFLALILLLIYFLLRKVLPRVAQISGFRNRNVKIVERLPVDAKKSLIVVEVQDKAYLLACSDNAITILIELDRSKMEVKPAVAETTGSGFDIVFKKFVFRSKSGGSPRE